LSPDVDVNRRTPVGGGVAAAFGFLVDVGLDDGRPDHGHGAGVEAPGDLIDGCEVPAHLSEPGPDEEVADGNENDEGEGVKVREDIVGEAVQGHDRRLGGQVVVELVVGEPVQGIPEEDFASCEATLDFVDPGVVERHPRWPDFDRDVRWLDILPEGAIVQAFVCADWIQRPSAFVGKKEDCSGFSEDRATWWCTDVSFAAPQGDEGT